MVYDNDNIFLIVDPGYGQINMISQFPINPDFLVKYDKNGSRLPGMVEAEAEYFLRYLENLPTDRNDTVFLYVSAHGNSNIIHVGIDVSVDRLSEVLSKMKYKELIAFFNSCGSNEYTKRLYDLQGRTPNILLVGYDSNLVGNISLEIKRIMSYLDLGLNMKEVLKKIKAQQKAITIIGESEVFTNPLVYKKS